MDNQIPLDGMEAEVVLNIKFRDGHVITRRFEQGSIVFHTAMTQVIDELSTQL
jgi:hypothetical protein